MYFGRPHRSPLVTGHSSLVTSSAFTLLELLVVVGIISLLLVAVIPAVNSLSKSSGRKGAISNLLGAIEQARAEAIKTGQATYIVFPTFSTASPKTDPYNYKSYAIFGDEPDPVNPNTFRQKQLTNWKTVPTGVALRTAPMANLKDMSALVNTLPTFTPATGTTPTFHCLRFNANGEVEAPVPQPGVPISVEIFEGFVAGNTEKPTSNPIVFEKITIAPLTGRAEHAP